MTLVRHADRRRTETPIAVMTTLASPTQGGAGTAVWHVDMPAGRQGPRHAFETEQIWCFLDGGATVVLGGETLEVTAGDTLVMPADVPRQVTTAPGTGFTAVVTAPAGSRVYDADSDCDIAPEDGERLVPPWVR
ncbi:cupin domain-containing protein [Actinomadura sp. 21ATH]|uniref:cupin domain-containing protein n=1 Tax=Actinomadura sp. 21ATH TaxID=1735444 RepID=UPI0035C1E131